MGTITISISDEAEKSFRQAVEREKGTGKGKLGEATEEAIRKWTEEKQQKEIAERILNRMSTGFNMGKIKIKHRDELYER